MVIYRVLFIYWWFREGSWELFVITAWICTLFLGWCKHWCLQVRPSVLPQLLLVPYISHWTLGNLGFHVNDHSRSASSTQDCFNGPKNLGVLASKLDSNLVPPLTNTDTEQGINIPLSLNSLSVKCELLLLSHSVMSDSETWWSPPGSSVRGISQARILEWVAISFSRGSSSPRDWSWVSCIGRQILSHCATWQAPKCELMAIQWENAYKSQLQFQWWGWLYLINKWIVP